MKTKERVVELLYNSEDFISGEEIGKILGITRNSVWKAVNTLKKQGYEIEASTLGYKLLIKDNEFNAQAIKKHFDKSHTVHFYKEESSSNTLAKHLARDGEEEGSVVVVESQTMGRGRLGRSFISKSENGLYMSIILRPSISASECVSITVLCAVAVLESIEELTGKECTIKWVNDIYIGEKKCAGILTEASFNFESGGVEYAIVGVGVNLSPPQGGFEKEIEEIACGVYENEYPKGLKAKLCASIVNKLFDYYKDIEKKEFIKKYKAKSNIIGKSVDVYLGEKIICGDAIDIDENANLVVVDETGQRHVFNSGEARVRKRR